jgi:AcrR family transcriptional regulator
MAPVSEHAHRPHADADPAASDQRLLRGARTRRTIVRHAVDVASLEGLNGLSLGRLAADLGLSKSGVQTLFGAKENLQVAAAECAREVFHDAVIRPALAEPPGVARLRALTERWIAYAETPLFPGGCFWAANLAEFDSRPGQVRDTLSLHQQNWRDLIAAELRHAADTGQIADLDADLAAFQIDAVLMAANTALRLGDEKGGDKVRRVIEGLLTPAH